MNALLDRILGYLPKTALFRFVAARILVPYWARRTPTAPQKGGAPPGNQPGDQVQHMMNLVMPLKDKSAIGRAGAVMALAQNLDAIYAGLDNVGTVHFARFVIIDDNLCMISVYDGDFSNYIRDFIATIGSVFDALVALIEDGDRVIPCERNIEAFIAWVHARDAYQVPDLPADVMTAWDEANMPKGETVTDLTLLPRELVLQLHANPQISIGSGYRRYPTKSAARIRDALGMGW